MLISATTRKALATVKRVKRGGLALAAALAVSSILLSGAGVTPAAAPGAGASMSRFRVAAALGGMCSLGLGVAALVLEGHFYTNFERHPVLE